MKAEDDHSPAVGDKLRFKEADWDNLREQCAAAGIPNNVIAVLNERQARVLAGESEILDWDQGQSEARSRMKRLLVSDEAFADLNDGFLFYDLQESGFGDRPFPASCLRISEGATHCASGLRSMPQGGAAFLPPGEPGRGSSLTGGRNAAPP